MTDADQKAYDRAVLDLAKSLYDVDYFVAWDHADQTIKQNYLNTAHARFSSEFSAH